MKQIPCQTISGLPCKLMLEGRTFDEILAQAEKHFTEESSHNKLLRQLNTIDRSGHQDWHDNLKKMWEETPDIPDQDAGV